MEFALSFLFYTNAILYVVASVIIGIIFAVVAWLVMRKIEGCYKWLLVFVSAITPLLFVCVELVIGLIGSFCVSVIHGVDLGFCDEWWAPLTKSHYLYAIDLPFDAWIDNRDESKPKLDDGIVQHLWVSEDSIVVTCSKDTIMWTRSEDRIMTSGLKTNIYSLLVFYPQVDSAVVLLHHVDSLRLVDALQCRNLDPKSAMIPNDYFCMTQAEAHSVEAPVRHFLSSSFIVALWTALILFVRKRRKKSIN
jgi:hypothetical protein